MIKGLSVMRVIFCAGFIFLGLFLGHAALAQTGLTIIHAPDLRNVCKEAYNRYQSDPERLARTECGSYIQGFITGFSTGAIVTFTRDEYTVRHLEILKKVEKEFCARPKYSLKNYISDYIQWIRENPEYKGSVEEDLLGSIQESCAKTDK